MKTTNDSPVSTPHSASSGYTRDGRRRRHIGARRRYRVEIVNDNTLSRVWSVRFIGFRAILAAIAAIAALASLVAVIFMFTPLGRFLPGQLRGDLRASYAETLVRVDSLERLVRRQQLYADNIIAILEDSVPEPVIPDKRQPSAAVVDSLISRGDAERQFVRRFEEEQRFNLSVLSPIAAEGMIFLAPSETETGAGPVTAVYRGTVISTVTDDDGFSSVIVQHPNDFITVYANLDQCYIDRGMKISAGQRIGHATAARPLLFELWHAGTKLDPATYIDY